MNFEAWQWGVLFAGAVLIGVSKTGLTGVAILAVALLPHVFEDARQATGLVLPLLIVGDFVAVVLYQRHAQWCHFRRLFPWAAVGLVVGFLVLKRISGREAEALTGLVVVGLSVLHAWRRWWTCGQGGERSEVVLPAWFAPLIGVLAGFTTLVANAAGPLATIFFLAARLPKMEFVATGAVFFMILNWVKVPFMVWLGLISSESLKLNALLLPAVLSGAFIGRWLLTRIKQETFEGLVLILGALSGVKLLVG